MVIVVYLMESKLINFNLCYFFCFYTKMAVGNTKKYKQNPKIAFLKLNA